MSLRYNLFSKMKWLDAEINRNETSPGRNRYSDWYYSTLVRIKKAQEDFDICDDLYIEFTGSKEDDGIAYGYYHANIHYDLFFDLEDKEVLEDRIIDFLKKTPAQNISSCSWFRPNFMFCFIGYLSKIVYKTEWKNPVDGWVVKTGNEKEIRIVNLFKEMCGIKGNLYL